MDKLIHLKYFPNLFLFFMKKSRNCLNTVAYMKVRKSEAVFEFWRFITQSHRVINFIKRLQFTCQFSRIKSLSLFINI